MPIFFISVLVQVALVVHIVKTGRNTMWIWIVVMLPLAGSIAYLLVEVLPELAAGRSGRKARKNIGSLLNPNRTINTASNNYAISDTVENSIKLADECLEKGMFEEAKNLYVKCLTGIHEDNPDIQHGLARAEFGLQHYARTKTILDDLIENSPDYKSPEAHLLYARTAEALNDTELAEQEYEVLDGYFPGPEATYRYALLLKKIGKQEKANSLLEKIIQFSKVSDKYYNIIYKEWIKKAKSEFSN